MASTSINVDTAKNSLAEIEESLRQIPSTDFQELNSYAKPPLGCLAIFEGIGILLDPSKQHSEWTDDKKLMSGSKGQFLNKLFDLDKNKINDEQLQRLESILARDDCQPTNLAKTSRICFQLCLWLGEIVKYVKERQTSH